MTTPTRLGDSEPLVAPLYQTSVFSLPDLDALDRILDAGEHGFIYARDSHPNARLLAAELSKLEGAAWTVVCASGMASISVPLLAKLQQGDHVLASTSLYGRTNQLLSQELSRFGVGTTYVDTSDTQAVRAALEKPSRLLIVETVSNPMLRLADLGAIVNAAHERGCLVLVDNTFATPLLTKPLALGADFVIESLTKMLGGHSDVTLGAVCGRDADDAPQMNQVASIWGLASNPFDCWLALRGLATFDLRMKAACENAARLAEWLPRQHGVSLVIYPGLSDHPDHELAAKLLGGGFGNMLCLELDGGRDAVNRFMRAAVGIPFSPSLGHTRTTISHPWSTSHRYTSPAEKRRQGITEGLLRVSVGFEPFEEILRAMAPGFGG